MAFDPLHCLGAVFMAGTLRDSKVEDPFWKKAILGVVTAIIVAAASGISSGYVLTREVNVKLDLVMDRLRDDRNSLNEELRELKARIRALEARK